MDKEIENAPPFEEELNGTTYYKSISKNGKISTVYRIIIDNENEELTSEVYDKWDNTWIDDPDVVMAITGMDDKGKYIPITEEEAFTFVNPTKNRKDLGSYVSKKLKEI
jgi:hypothetical protein